MPSAVEKDDDTSDIGGVAGFQHLHLHEGGDGLDVVRRQAVKDRGCQKKLADLVWLIPENGLE